MFSNLLRGTDPTPTEQPKAKTVLPPEQLVEPENEARMLESGIQFELMRRGAQGYSIDLGGVHNLIEIFRREAPDLHSREFSKYTGFMTAYYKLMEENRLLPDTERLWGDYLLIEYQFTEGDGKSGSAVAEYIAQQIAKTYLCLVLIRDGRNPFVNDPTEKSLFVTYLKDAAEKSKSSETNAIAATIRLAAEQDILGVPLSEIQNKLGEFRTRFFS